MASGRTGDEAVVRGEREHRGGRIPLELFIPPQAKGLVLFAPCADVERSNDSRVLAWHLQQAGIATLSAPHLPDDEAGARMLVGSVDWVRELRETRDLPLAMLGLGASMSATFTAAAERRASLRALAIFAGRALTSGAAALRSVTAPALLIARRTERDSVRACADALDQLPAGSELMILQGGPGAGEALHDLVQAANFARAWLVRRLDGAK